MDASESESERKRQAMVICEGCNLNPSKYTCPGCSVRSCSLPCVKSHKQRTGCSGKRKATSFVHLSQFDDQQLVSDYNLLEEIKRVADSAKRARMQICGYQHFKLPYHLQNLRSAAFHRRTKILFLPNGMSRKEKNKSRHDHKNKIIYWTIEWRFHSTKDVCVIDHGINENAPLHTIIEKYLNPGSWNRKLRQYSKESLDDLKLVIQKYPKGRESPFYQLDVRAPIKEQLANVTLLEYPIIHVFLPPHNFDFEVIEVGERYPQKPKPEIDSEQLNPQKGVTFKEEEIEENENPSEPHVLDLIDHQGSNHVEVDTEPKADPQASSQMLTVADPNLEDFDSDQGLIDAYSDLLAEVNPDEFLDFDCDFLGELPDNIDFSTLGQDDFEDGEIPWP